MALGLVFELVEIILKLKFQIYTDVAIRKARNRISSASRDQIAGAFLNESFIHCPVN